MEDEQKRVESHLAETAFINTQINFKAFNVDFESLKIFFTKAQEHYKPFDSEEESDKTLKDAIKGLAKKIMNSFDNFSACDEI